MLSVMYRCAGTATLLNNGSMGVMRWRRSTEFKLGDSKETLHSRWKWKTIDRCVEGVFKEHHQVAEHLANLGIMNSETWDAVREYCDGSKKDGVVIKAVYRESWITINKIAVPLKVSTALATEIAGARVLTEVLNLSVERK